MKSLIFGEILHTYIRSYSVDRSFFCEFIFSTYKIQLCIIPGRDDISKLKKEQLLKVCEAIYTDNFPNSLYIYMNIINY